MTLQQLLPFANHLWQTTLCAVAAGLLTLLLRKNRAQVRYWLWIAASVKFLIPFSILMDIGGLLARHTTAEIVHWRIQILGWEWDRIAPSTLVSATGLSSAIQQVSEPFTATPPQVAASGLHWSHADAIVPVLIAFWAVGFVSLVCRWTMRWRRMHGSVSKASPLDLSILDQPIGLPVRSSAAFGEPGVFGIFRPVLLLPEKILECLTAPEMESVVAHELCHVRRRDNLATVIHMAVEAVFWFHPLVWWLGARLMEERERACDEHVLQMGGDPRAYAEGILKICEMYLASPLACVAGVTGGDLKRRINMILAGPSTHKLNIGRKLLLTTAGALAMAGPILIGLAITPRGRAQSQAASRPAFEVASVKPDKSEGMIQMEPARFRALRISLEGLIEYAWNINHKEIVGPAWMRSETYDIEAKPERGVSIAEIRLMLQALLEDRFKLSAHRKLTLMPVYALVAAKNGPRLREGAADEEPSFSRTPGHIVAENEPISSLIDAFRGNFFVPGLLDRPGIDMTGLKGRYDFTLEWAQHDTDTGPSLFTAVQEQLGLRVVAQQRIGEILVIDHVEKVPTEN